MQRKLSSRHMQMIALGGTIGVGLFMGSASTIQWTGPSVMLAYALAGLFLYFIMRALGEMLYAHPVTGSFASFASEYLHPVFGYLTAWANIFQFLVVGMSEMIAIGSYFEYWWPGLPQWIPGLVALLTLTIANLISVKAFGELEFWFAMVKVVTIILMIVAGLGLIFFGLGNGGHALGVSNLWSHGGFFTGGLSGFVFALSIVVASYQGVELLGITAGEAEDPRPTIVKSIQSTVGRILIFYVGAIFVIVTVYPWDKLGTIGSPFVETFAKVGIAAAATIINFVVITAALSGANSGIYSASRMGYTLAETKQLPQHFTKLNRHGVPFWPVVTIAAGIGIGVILNFVVPLLWPGTKNLFVIVYSSSVLPGLIPWIVILLSQIQFRKQHPVLQGEDQFRMPFSPWSNYLTLAFLAVVVIFMAINPDTRIPLAVGVIFIAAVLLHYWRTHRGQ